MKGLEKLFESPGHAARKAKVLLLSFVFAAAIGLLFTSCLEQPEGDWGGEPSTGGDGPGGGLTLAAALLEIHTNAESNSEHTIELTGSGNIGAQLLSFTGRSNITIQITGSGKERIISLTDNGSLFTIGSGVTLILGNRVTLKGHSGSNYGDRNNAPLVMVNSGGMLIMKTGAKISSNNNSSSSAGGVYVATGGSFLMEGGDISGNTAVGYSANAGGVYVAAGGDFLMEGGRISDNAASYGGGVYVANGRFAITGGEISRNTASSYGGGIYVNDGNFTMEGGRISNNTAASSSNYGGGGVYVRSAVFTMKNGEIYGNTAPSGGGVYVASYGRIAKTGGIIYGYTLGDSNRNTATTGIAGNNGGHAVYVDSNPNKRRETTAGSGLNLDSDIAGAAGGWE